MTNEELEDGVDALLSELNDIARRCDGYEYGLPLGLDGWEDVLRVPVRAFVARAYEAAARHVESQCLPQEQYSRLPREDVVHFQMLRRIAKEIRDLKPSLEVSPQDATD